MIDLGLTGSLRLTLRTTNPIANLFGSVRNVSRCVKRWKGGRMMLRWCAGAVLDAGTRFRKIRGVPRSRGSSLPSELTHIVINRTGKADGKAVARKIASVR